MQAETRHKHRREQIIDNLAEILEVLMKPPSESRYPIQVKTVQKRWTHWTQLDAQGALPAILITYADGGSAPPGDSVGFIDEQYPLSVTAVLKEERGGKPITSQASDMHYSIGRLINVNRTLNVEGVDPEESGIRDWRSSDESLGEYLLLKFRTLWVHRYHKNENV